ncbi:MAG TPA: hypothetical protein VHM25_17885 [Polyangiaceae bacterium]|jgi:hypothetical protein|nr:hypothetical protein [Polyangiaceae bacterium]
MALDSDLREPGYYADPLRVITQPELPRSNEASSEISSFDIDRDFRDGSQMRPRFVGFGTKSDSLGLIQREGAGRFDLGPFWNVGCEQVVRCTTGENRRNRCPSIPFATNADFFEDSVLRVLDVADQPWLSSFYNGSSGAALLLEGSPRKGAANPVQAGSNTLIGVLSDSETSVTGRPSDRPAAYFAPTFAAGVGGWLERRIGDFDADCDPDDSDDSPTVANASSSCSDDQNRLREAGWSRVSLDSQLAAPTLPALAWSPRGSVAAAAHDALSLDLFVVSGDGTLYRARAVPEIDWNQLKWSPWAPIAVRGQLRGELSAVARGSDVLLCGLTVEQQLRCFTVDAAGEAFEEAAPNPAGAGFFSSGPAAVPAPFATTGDIDLFIRGGDGVLLRYEQRGGTWEELVELVEPKTGDIDDKAAVLTSPPVATVAGNKIELFARGSKFELLHWTIDSDASPRFSERIGDMVMEGVPAVYSSSADRVAVLSRDGTGALLQLVREGINSFWRPVGTQLLTNPVPVVPAPGYVHLFAMSEPDKFLSLMRHE